jgi:hypothetical protein
MNPNFVIMGLPASGKTTFLAALWHIIEAEETNCQLQLDSYEGDLKYLNAIARAWRSFEKVPRTSQVGDVDVTICLVDAITGAKGRAFFPDLAGETFDAQVESRRCRPGFLRNVETDDGILLFVTVNAKQDSLSIVELNSMLPPGIEAELEADGDRNQAQRAVQVVSDNAAVSAQARLVSEERQSGGAANVVEGAAVAAPRFPEWEPKMVPAQVRLVQLLSDLLRPPFAPKRRRVALLLSAWDVLKGTTITPEGWLSANMPLLDQFLRTNGDSFDMAIYGVSAQGVDLDDKDAVSEATKLLPSRRISIIGSGAAVHDITAPLVWLMSGA